MQTANVLALEKQIHEHEPKLLALPEEVTHKRLGDGLWSGLEIVGHLSDSAAMNRQRIVRAHYEAPYDFPFYDQPQWVQIQAYEAYDWCELVSMCIGEYRHILHVLEHLPDDSMDLRCPIKFGSSDYVTLDWLVGHVYRHNDHHLQQVYWLAGQGDLPVDSELYRPIEDLP